METDVIWIKTTGKVSKMNKKGRGHDLEVGECWSSSTAMITPTWQHGVAQMVLSFL